MDRGLDGYYFRIRRNGKWQNVCFSDLTEEEMNKVLRDKKKEFLKSMCIGLGKTIRNMGDEINIVAEKYCL